MALEAWRSAANERCAAGRAAHESSPDRSYPWMRVAYPAGFLAVCPRGLVARRAVERLGHRWAPCIFSRRQADQVRRHRALGKRWSFRVLVLPGAPLVSDGIYALLRHPNYVGVAGEVVGIALWMQAPITGTLFAVTFGLILAVADPHRGARARPGASRMTIRPGHPAGRGVAPCLGTAARRRAHRQPRPAARRPS